VDVSVTYVKTTWVNEITPTSPANMNHLEAGIEGASAPVVTTLPAAGNGWAPFAAEPATGQEIILRVNDGGGNVAALWPLMYVAGATHPWYAVGGLPMHAQTVDTTAFAVNFTANGAYQDSPGTAAPSLSLPVSGDYFIEHGHASYNDASTGYAGQSFAIGGTPAVDGDWAIVQSPSGTIQVQASASVRRRKNDLAAAALVKLQLKGPNGSAVHWRNPWLSILPVRVG
jgi:hypothetical protein